MPEDWYEKQERQFREWQENDLRRIEREARRINKAIGVTPDVSVIDVPSKELPSGVIRFDRAKVKRWKRKVTAA